MTIQADANGRLAGAFAIPSKVPVGAKRVTFRGSGGSTAVSTYTAQGWKTITTAAMTSVTQLVPFTPPAAVSLWRVKDPVAQTHSFLSDRQISGYDIQIARVGDRKKPVILQARSTVNGYPGPDVIAEAVIDMTDIVPGRVFRRASFTLPWLGRADDAYALVLLCDDAEHAVNVAKVGGFDQERSWVGTHPYNIGSFFDGSDNKAWLVHPGLALTYRAVARKYIRSMERIEFGAVEVQNLTDLIPMILADRPQGTEVEIEITLPSGQKIVTTPAAAVALSESITGQIQLAMTLRGTATLSPIVYPEAQLVAGTQANAGDYVSRAFAAARNTRIRVIAEMNLPGDASAAAAIQTGETVDGITWQTITGLPTVTPMKDGFAEYEWEADFNPVGNLDHTRIRLDWTGNPAARPQLRNVRAAVMLRT